MVTKKRGLGRGLDALLKSSESLDPVEEGDRLRTLAVDLMQRGQYQPRTDMDQEALDDLADSIKAQGLIQPILVRPLKGRKKYEIIAGERRWRAAQAAGLHEVPVVIREVADQTAMCMALIENIQREDLNPLEEAQALQRLLDEFQMTHEGIAEAVGRSRSSVSNLLRLLELDNKVKKFIQSRELEMGHARALLSLSKPKQADTAREVIKKGLSVRETESLVRGLLTKKSTKKPKEIKLDPNIRQLQEELSERLGAAVKIAHSSKGKGTLSVVYHSLDELEGILKRIK